MPINHEEETKAKYIFYYQWVAIVLAGQAMMSWVPHLLWRVFSRRLPLLLSSAREAAVPDHELRRKAVSILVAALEEQAEAQARFRRIKSVFSKCLCGASPSARLTVVFFVMRLLFIGNAVGQIYLMRKFLGTNHTMFGLQVFQDLTSGREWDVSGHFPRVTYCTLKVRKMSGNQPTR